MAFDNVVDVLIIGGGFAGLSAALTALRQNVSVVLYDSGSYRDRSSNLTHTLPTWEHRESHEYRAAARIELKQYRNFELRNAEVFSVGAAEGDKGFVGIDNAGITTRCSKVIIATGVEDIMPPIPGFEDGWGRSILHCLFCDGYRTSPAASAGVLAIGLISNTSFALHMTHMAASFAREITIYTNGNTQLKGEIDTVLSTSATPTVPVSVDARPISSFQSADDYSSVAVKLPGGETITHAYLACAPGTKLRGKWDKQLGLQVDGMGKWKVGPQFFESTEAPGVYVCGDAMTNLTVAATAVASGSTVGAAVAIKIQEEKWGLKPAW